MTEQIVSMYLRTHTHTHTTINEKRWHGFEKEQGGVCGKIGREEMIQS